MHTHLFAVLPMMLADMSFGLFMLAIGVAAGWWIFRQRGDSQLDTAHAKAAMANIRELATSVAHDVGEHSHRVQEISDGLSGAQADGSINDQNVVMQTVAEMVKANEWLEQQLASAERKLQEQAEAIEIHAADARTDALTGLANRRAFDAELDRRFAEWKRHQTAFSMFMIDVDHFKKFNDVHGHQAGDEVLRGVARVLTDTVREVDIVCRYGGEEFSVIMPGTEGQVGQQCAERARQAIEAACFNFEGTELRVTASVGLGQIAVGEDNASLVKRADEALYASKEAGRNNAHFHDGEKSLPITHREESTAQAPEANAAVSEDKLQETLGEEQATETLDRLPGDQLFSDELRRRVAEGQRFKVPLSVMIVHLDDVERFVSSYGAGIGDVLLDTVAQYLEILLREMDLLARSDDGNFRVMLPGSSLEESVIVANRVRQAVSSCVIPLGNKKIQLSVSLGLAEMLASDDTSTLIERAQGALTQAQANERNRAFLSDGQSYQEVPLDESATAEAM